MKNSFLIPGYGVPKNILKDENYNFYLKIILNAIFDLTVKKKQEKSVIIFSGGKTDCYRPYKRTEADEMIKLFRSLINHARLGAVTKNWQLIPEKKSVVQFGKFIIFERPTS